MADPAIAKESPEAGASHRELGNAAFKRGKLHKAVEEYTKAFQAKEDGFALALSNRAICHLKLGDYRDAIDTADLCLKQKDPPLKAHLTKFKALAAHLEWLEAFNCLRRLQSMPNLPEDVVTAALIEEKAKRSDRIALCKGNKVGPDGVFEDEILKAKVNCDDDFTRLDEAHLVHASLPATVGLVVPKGLKCEKVDIIGARNEDAFAFAIVQYLAAEATFRLVGPEVAAGHKHEQVREIMGHRIRAIPLKGLYHEFQQELAEAADLAVIACPNFDTGLEDWAPTILRLISSGVLTVVTGYGRDQSMVQNEDILCALGCNIVAETQRSEHMFRHGAMCKHYHVMAFQGGNVSPNFDLGAIRKELHDRGFDIEGPEGSM